MEGGVNTVDISVITKLRSILCSQFSSWGDHKDCMSISNAAVNGSMDEVCFACACFPFDDDVVSPLHCSNAVGR